MSTLFLSGGSYGANWLPMVLPLVGLVIVLFGVEAIVKYVKKRKHMHSDTNSTDLNDYFEDIPDKHYPNS
jgi:hypothetical protein